MGRNANSAVLRTTSSNQSTKMANETLPVHHPSKAPQLIYTCKQHKDAFFYFLLVLTVVFLLGSAILLAFLNVWLSVIITVPVTVIVVAILVLLLPRRYEVWSDSIKIVFIPGYKYSISLASVLSIEENPPCCSSTPGINFSYSVSRRVMIHRRGLGVKLAPEHPTEFCQQIRYAMTPGSHPAKTI